MPNAKLRKRTLIAKQNQIPADNTGIIYILWNYTNNNDRHINLK